jgi:chromosome partitioning protein
MNIQQKKFTPVVAVLNMKGGVGKTTISSNAFRMLFQRKRVSTLLIDLDPQFNLSQSLFTRTKYETIKADKKTILSVMEPPSSVGLFNIATSSEPPPSPSQICTSLFSFRADPSIMLAIIAGDFDIVKYSLMHDESKLEKVRNRFFKFIECARKEFGVVCIDCNPSSSFLTLCALEVCSHVLVPIRPDRYSILGMEMLSKFIEQVPSISPKPQLIIALNGIPRSVVSENIRQIESELRAHDEFGAKTMVAVVPDSGHLRVKTDYTGFAVDKSGPWTDVLKNDIRMFADELATKIGIKGNG